MQISYSCPASLETITKAHNQKNLSQDSGIQSEFVAVNFFESWQLLFGVHRLQGHS